MTERSDIHKSSIVNRQSSIPACPGWVYATRTLAELCKSAIHPFCRFARKNDRLSFVRQGSIGPVFKRISDCLISLAAWFHHWAWSCNSGKVDRICDPHLLRCGNNASSSPDLYSAATWRCAPVHGPPPLRCGRDMVRVNLNAIVLHWAAGLISCRLSHRSGLHRTHELKSE